jgi:hypothetical protein
MRMKANERSAGEAIVDAVVVAPARACVLRKDQNDEFRVVLWGM